ncbi:putative transporter [Vibrio variabilis]|uniref:Transporter n=1 Tax=Vibrio variabilis TaxID=990271 RepID=A0ABQ0JIZ3_9VIBR|nr:putative transporter [Vibrio variabilis]
MMPIDWIPIDDLTLIQHRLLAIFLLAALLWYWSLSLFLPPPF